MADSGDGLASKVTLAFQRCLEAMLRLKSPEPAHEVVKLIASLSMTPRQVEQLYRLFRKLKQYDPMTFQCGVNEASTPSMARMIMIQREWTSDILKYLLELAGFTHTINWDGFLYVFLQYCTLSKVELCQVLFYVIAKATKSWTVQVLTSTQLDEFYEDYQDCPVNSFNTSSVDFAKLPKAKYRMTDFIELVHHFPQLQAPATHLQRQLQQAMPGLRFWNDYDRIGTKNRRITIDFFACKKIISIFDVVRGAALNAAKAEREQAEREAKSSMEAAARLAMEKNQHGGYGSDLPPGSNQQTAASTTHVVQRAAPTPPGQFPPPPAPMPRTFANESTKLGYVPMPLGPTPAPKPRKQFEEIDLMPAWMRQLIKAHEGEGSRPRRGAALTDQSAQEEVPLNLPKPWVAVYDPASEKHYYWNPEERTVSWQPPAPPKILSVEAAKDVIRGTFGTDPQQVIDAGVETLRVKVRQEDERAAEKRRVQELEFIHRSRLSLKIQESIVASLEKMYQCELIERR